MQIYNSSTGQWEDEEEERRRREAAAAQSGSTAFSDIPGLLYDKKMSDLENRYAGVTQMFEDPAAAMKRRIQEGTAEEPAPSAPTPVKQTITTDPVTGEQTMKIEGSVQDLTAANPLTPTVPGPAVPGAVPQPAQQAQAAQPSPQMTPAQMSQAPGAPVGPQQTTDLAEIQRRQEVMRNMMAQSQPAAGQPAPAAAPTAMAPPAAQPAPAAQPVAPAAMPGANLSQIAQAAPAPIDPNAPMPAIGAPPVPGPGVQVASTVPSAGVAEAAAAQAAQTARPQWAVDLEAAGQDQTKLIDIAANKAYPKDVRDDAKAKLRTAMANADAASEAEKTVTAAAQGDSRAQQKLLNSIKPSTIKKEEEGKVTEGSYIRAYLYARLGLNELAQEEQQKIMGKNKFGQVQVNGQSYEVETDRAGRVVTARDNEGNKVDAPILNKIRAEATKFGVQSFGFTGGISTVPSTGEPLQARQNSISGDAEYVHMTGPKKGQVYTGSEIPVQQRVGTQAMVDYNKKLIDFNTNPNIAGATELMKIAVGNDRGDGAEIAKARADIANKMGVGGLNQILGNVPGASTAAPAPAQAAAPAPTQAAAPAQKPVTQAAPAPAPAAGGIPVAYTPSAKRQGESENMYQSRVKREEAAFNAEIQRRKEMQLALEKPAAAAAGADAATTVKNQAFADRTYDLIKPINEAILKSTGSSIGAGVDTVAAAFAKSTEGSKAISRLNVLSYGILSNIPRFEGPQSDIDVQMYKQAAGDFANRKLPVEDRLAALDALRTILQRYDKAGKNDWNFGSTGQPATGGMKIIRREKVQ